MWRVLDVVGLCCVVAALSYHVVSGGPLDTMMMVAVWGLAMWGLRIWNRQVSDRRAILDMVVIAIPASILAVVAPITSTVSAVATSVVCARIAVPYVISGIKATHRMRV